MESNKIKHDGLKKTNLKLTEKAEKHIRRQMETKEKKYMRGIERWKQRNRRSSTAVFHLSLNFGSLEYSLKSPIYKGCLL